MAFVTEPLHFKIRILATLLFEVAMIGSIYILNTHI